MLRGATVAPRNVVTSLRHERFLTGSANSAASGSGVGIIPRVSAFLAGVGCTCVASYVQLHEDIWESTLKVEKALADLRTQSVEEVAHLRLRVSTLEKELLVLKARDN